MPGGELIGVGKRPIADMGSSRHLSLMKRALLKPELRSLSGQIDEDLSDLTPVSGSFCHTLRAEIGAKGEKGAEAFEFDVYSPEWLENELESFPILPGGPRLIAKRFDPVVIEEYVRKRLLHATGPDWQTIATKLAQWSRWEFDNYEA